jgi:hypothetical protein
MNCVRYQLYVASQVNVLVFYSIIKVAHKVTTSELAVLT